MKSRRQPRNWLKVIEEERGTAVTKGRLTDRKIAVARTVMMVEKVVKVGVDGEISPLQSIIIIRIYFTPQIKSCMQLSLIVMIFKNQINKKAAGNEIRTQVLKSRLLLLAKKIIRNWLKDTNLKQKITRVYQRSVIISSHHQQVRDPFWDCALIFKRWNDAPKKRWFLWARQ